MTLVLVAFLVLLLVGLATYARIETAAAGNQQRQAQARENALFALQVALGQLQKHAGPDQRATATGNSTGSAGARHYTGVWDSTTPGTGPVTWLVSGSERAGATPDTVLAAALDPGSNATSDQEFLVGSRTVSANADRIKVAKQDITALGVPGQTGAVRVGRYAWWVGDQGVKAPVAVVDTTDAITFAPYDTAEARARIRQQIPGGAGASDTSGAPVFEPRDANNAPLVANEKITTAPQIAFLRTPTNAQLGLARVQQNFHAWSPHNFAVLADTKAGGLRQDLSLDPTLLGGAFAAWADYGTHMEPPVPGAAASPVPDYGAEPIRRRHRLTPHFTDGSNGSHQIGPVLTYFLLTFNVRTVGGTTRVNAPLEVRARWMATLWNPYSAALVPEDLQLQIDGLPGNVHIINDHPMRAGVVVGNFSPEAIFGSPAAASRMVVSLPWATAPVPTGTVMEDRASWLPGRAYTWRSDEDTTGAGPGASGFASTFYSRTLSAAGDGVIFPLGLTIADGDDDCHLEVTGSSNLDIRIYAMRAGGPEQLARLRSCDFVTAFSTTPQPASGSDYQFSYVFRLAESLDNVVAPGGWLTTDGRDVRRSNLNEPGAYIPAENGDDPSQYGQSYSRISSPDRLLDRSAGSLSYNEDVPLFELPRAPLLSVGALQHFRIRFRRPFMIGNSWGEGETLNGIPVGQIFDRFFFSGLAAGVTPTTSPTGGLVLPNPLLRPLRLTTGAHATETDLRGVAAARSSAQLLQSGAFNLNSTNAEAWAAVLRGGRLHTGGQFRFLDADVTTGTKSDAALDAVPSVAGRASVRSVSTDPSAGEAVFFRFPQSAQETYLAFKDYAASTVDPLSNQPADPPSVARTELFRKGMRKLTATQVATLSRKIADLVRARITSAGPFRSLEEFLAPTTAGAPSLLEQAIVDADVDGAQINIEASGSPLEFSSQFLTQADIMTALAPVLFPRSDTFVIRTYGEAWNPVTAATEGRAWCEAVVQRVPEYFDPPKNAGTATATGDAPDVLPAALMSELNKQQGRRFKVVSFRWLTRSDI